MHAPLFQKLGVAAKRWKQETLHWCSSLNKDILKGWAGKSFDYTEVHWLSGGKVCIRAANLKINYTVYKTNVSNLGASSGKISDYQ